MELKNVADIRPHDDAEPLKVRVLRTWVPYAKRNEFSYLFVDVEGHAIEAIADLTHQSHFTSKITIQSCYKVSDYLSDNARSYMNVVPHAACIKIGLKTSFEEVEDSNIPNYYFNFVTHDRLPSQLNNHLLLTDYIARMVTVSDILNKASNNLLKIKLQDQGGEFIEATLWEDIAFAFNRGATLHKKQPIIIALTSLKVAEYQGKLQLGSTNATSITINPPIEETQIAISRLRNIPTTSTSILAANNQLTLHPLQEIIDQARKVDQRISYYCEGYIKDIDTSRQWYYKSCTQCKKKVIPKGDKYACLDHGEVVTPKQMYAVNATLADSTSTVAVVLFNDVMENFLGMECDKLITQTSFKTGDFLPKPLIAIKGMKKIFQLHHQRKDVKDTVTFTVNKVCELQKNLSDIPSSSNATSSKYKKRKAK